MNSPVAPYALGNTDAEHARLMRQAEWLAPHTARLFREAGIGARHRVVDLGCGDFRVGQNILAPGIRYIGVDVVPELISYNTQTYGSEAVRFECRDIATEDLPPGDICLIRQVFQHLSNEEIAAVLAKLTAYKTCLITEHYPRNPTSCIPNLNKPHGGDVRFSDNSAVFLDQPPFNVRHAELVLTIPHRGDWGTLRTFRINRA